jgi:LysM repeat protein
LWDDAVQVKVKSGDTLESIAATYRATSWAIVQINNLDADRPLEPGRMLTIPRSVYANATPPGAASPTAARPAAEPVARLAPKLPPPAEAPAAGRPPAPASAPKPTEPPPASDANSFSDRWRSSTEH